MGLRRRYNLAALDWDQALSRLRAGEGVRAVCNGVDGMPALHHWRKRIETEPAFAEQVKAIVLSPAEKMRRASAARMAASRARRSQLDWDGFVARIRAGELLGVVCNEGDPMPSTFQYEYRRDIDPEFASVMSIVLNGRRGCGAVSEQRLDLVEQHIQAGGTVASAAVEVGLHVRTLFRVKRRNALFASRIALFAMQRRARKQRRQLPTPRHLHQEAFAKALKANEVFSLVDAAVPRYLAPDVREDIRSEIILAVLDRQVEVGEIKLAVRECVREHNLSVQRVGTSLDAVIGDDGFTLNHTMVAAYV